MKKDTVNNVVTGLVVVSSVIGIWQGVSWYRRKKKQEAHMNGIYDKAILAGVRQYRDCN